METTICRVTLSPSTTKTRSFIEGLYSYPKQRNMMPVTSTNAPLFLLTKVHSDAFTASASTSILLLARRKRPAGKYLAPLHVTYPISLQAKHVVLARQPVACQRISANS